MNTPNEAMACAESMADAAEFVYDELNKGEVRSASQVLREVESESMRLRRYLEELEKAAEADEGMRA